MKFFYLQASIQEPIGETEADCFQDCADLEVSAFSPSARTGTTLTVACPLD